jgi:hypothetical protein
MDDYIKKIDNFNNSLKYIDIIEDNMFCDNNSIVINYPEIITSYNEFYLLNDTEDEPMATMPLKEFSTEDMDELDDDFKFLDFLLNEEKQEPITLNEIYAEFYGRGESIDIKSSTDYNNLQFCYYCKNNMVLPNTEIHNFLNTHMSFKKNSKYLNMVFRLCPNIFRNYNVMENKYIRNYILEYLNIKETYYNNLQKNSFTDFDIMCQYETKTVYNSHIYENLFYQPKLEYSDYIKCDSCKNYICPIHNYLSNCLFRDCNFCTKKWSICGWCKGDFNEEIGCKYIHKI